MADEPIKKDEEKKVEEPEGKEEGKEVKTETPEEKVEEKKEEKEEIKVKEKVEDKPRAEEKKEEKREIKVSSKLAKIINEIEKLTVLELADLVGALEDKFGVSASIAAAPVAAAPTGGDEEEKTEQTVFNVIIKSPGGSKIPVIKAIRELVPTLGLKDAKDLVDNAPKEVLSQVDKTKAQEAKKKLEEAGAEVELK